MAERRADSLRSISQSLHAPFFPPIKKATIPDIVGVEFVPNMYQSMPSPDSIFSALSLSPIRSISGLTLNISSRISGVLGFCISLRFRQVLSSRSASGAEWPLSEGPARVSLPACSRMWAKRCMQSVFTFSAWSVDISLLELTVVIEELGGVINPDVRPPRRDGGVAFIWEGEFKSLFAGLGPRSGDFVSG